MISPVIDTINEVCPLLSEYEQFLSGKARRRDLCLIPLAQGSGDEGSTGGDRGSHLPGLAVRLRPPGT